MAFGTDHEITVVTVSTGVEFYCSGEKFAYVENGDKKLHLVTMTNPGVTDLAVDAYGKVIVVG